jgi:flagellar hook capping protein FlgD
VKLDVSSLDNSGWEISINQYDEDIPIPAGLIITKGFVENVSLGDTVTFNLIDGKLVAGTITKDPEDGPIDWNDIDVVASNSGFYNFEVTVDDGGEYSLYTDTGSYFMGIIADDYITDPAWRNIMITGDTTGVGFTINETHCHVSGTLTNISLPLDGSYYEVIARTGSGGVDGYYVTAQVDSATGTYSMNLCEGNWTIIPPCCIQNVFPADSTAITIGESPDTVKTIDFEYSIVTGIGDGNENSIPKSFALNQNYPNPFNPVTTIDFDLPARSYVTIDIFNALGQKVSTLIDTYKPAGSHSVTWEGKDNSGQYVSTGFYFYRIQTDDYEQSRKMLLLK